MKRYEKIVLEAEKNIVFEVCEGTSGELIIKAIKALNVDLAKYVNPVIPEGYKHVCGEWNNGFVIERFSDGSQFVWIPVGSLISNGTLDGRRFCEKFGRRYYSTEQVHYDDLSNELLEQFESVEKYGGFYISRYNISKSPEEKGQSIKGVVPWVNIDYDAAKMVASTIENSEAVKSHLVFGAEYDSILEWFIETKVRNISEITLDSGGWGNYHNKSYREFYYTGDYGSYRTHTTGNYHDKSILAETGSSEDWCTNNIYDLAGNVGEWTQERHVGDMYSRIVRGGNYECESKYSSVSTRYPEGFNYYSKQVGFRAALWIR